MFFRTWWQKYTLRMWECQRSTNVQIRTSPCLWLKYIQYNTVPYGYIKTQVLKLHSVWLSRTTDTHNFQRWSSSFWPQLSSSSALVRTWWLTSTYLNTEQNTTREWSTTPSPRLSPTRCPSTMTSWPAPPSSTNPRYVLLNSSDLLNVKLFLYKGYHGGIWPGGKNLHPEVCPWRLWSWRGCNPRLLHEVIRTN